MQSHKPKNNADAKQNPNEKTQNKEKRTSFARMGG